MSFRRIAVPTVAKESRLLIKPQSAKGTLPNQPLKDLSGTNTCVYQHRDNPLGGFDFRANSFMQAVAPIARETNRQITAGFFGLAATPFNRQHPIALLFALRILTFHQSNQRAAKPFARRQRVRRFPPQK